MKDLDFYWGFFCCKKLKKKNQVKSLHQAVLL